MEYIQNNMLPKLNNREIQLWDCPRLGNLVSSWMCWGQATGSWLGFQRLPPRLYYAICCLRGNKYDVCPKGNNLVFWEFCPTIPFLTSQIFCRWEVSARATASPKPRWTFFKLPEEHLRNSKLGRLCQDSQNWEQHSTKYFLQVKKWLLMINPRFYTKLWCFTPQTQKRLISQS